MSRLLKVFSLLLVIIVFLLPSFVQAIDVDMNLGTSVSSNNTSSTSSYQTSTLNSDTTSLSRK